MKKFTLVTVSALALFAANAAFAEDTTVPMPPKGDHHGKMLKEVDSNGDGAVSKDEWRAKGDTMFSEIDTNGDGTASPEELKAHHDKKSAEWKERRAERKVKMDEHKGDDAGKRDGLRDKLKEKHERKIPETPEAQ